MLVKKYGNRRLYDTETSRYVRLDEIAERIRAGADVRVVDAKTDTDLTASTLAQIIFEDRNAARLLPVPLLLQLIRMGDEPLAEFLGRYVSWALEIYMQARSGLGNFYNPLAGLWPFPQPQRPTTENRKTEDRKTEDRKTEDRTTDNRTTDNRTTDNRTTAPDDRPPTPDPITELRRELAELKQSLKRRSSRKR